MFDVIPVQEAAREHQKGRSDEVGGGSKGWEVMQPPPTDVLMLCVNFYVRILQKKSCFPRAFGTDQCCSNVYLGKKLHTA